MRRLRVVISSLRHVTCGTLLIAVLLISQPMPVASASTWSEPELLGEEDENAWFPEVDADVYGTVRFIWEGTSEIEGSTLTDANASALVLAQTGPGGRDTLGDIYVKDIYNAARPIIATDDSYVHVLSRSLRGGGVTERSILNFGGLYYMRASLSSDLLNVQSWSSPIPISTNASYWANITVLPDGAVLVVYNEQSSIWLIDHVEERTVLYSRRSDDYGATWGDPVRISYSGEPVARSSLSSTDDGRGIVVSWDEGYDNLSGHVGHGGIYTAVSTDGGESWHSHARAGAIEAQDVPEAGLRMPPSSYASRGTVEQGVVQTTDDVTMLVYRSTVDGVLLFRTSDDGGRSWSSDSPIPGAVPRPYSGSHHFDKLDMDVDGDGGVLLSYVGVNPDAPSGLSVMLTRYFGGQWEEPQTIATPEGFPEYPRLAVALGNQIYVTYFVREEMFEGDADLRVWMVRGESEARSIEPVPIGSMPPEPVSPDSETDATTTSPELFPLPERPGDPAPVAVREPSSVAPRDTLGAPFVRVMTLTAIMLLASAVIVIIARAKRGLEI